MIFNKKILIFMFICEILERLSYFIFNMAFLLYLFAPQSSGGLGISQEKSLIIITVFSTLMIYIPVFCAYFIDKNCGEYNALLYGGVACTFGYLLWSLVPASIPQIFLLPFCLCVFGASFIRPAMISIIAQSVPQNSLNRDSIFIFLISFINIAVVFSGTVASHIVKITEQYRIFILFPFGFMFIFTVLSFFIKKEQFKKIKSQFQESHKIQNKNMYITSLILILFVGISISISPNIFNISTNHIYWVVTLIGIITLALFWTYLSKKSILAKASQRKHFFPIGYFIFMVLFLLVPYIIHCFTGELFMSGPALFTAFYMLINFLIFPLLLSQLSRFCPKNYIATFQSIALTLFAFSSLSTTKLLKAYPLGSNKESLITGILFVFIFFVSLSLQRNYIKLSRKTP